MLFASLAAVISEDSSFMSIETSPSTVKKDETFMMTVRVTAHTPVNAVDITLAYPESQMVVDGIDTGTSVITLWTEQPYAKNGEIHLTGGVFQRGFLGEHVIARIKAHATESGLAHVTTNGVTLVAGDGKGTEIAIRDTGTSETRINVTNEDGSLEGTASVSIITDIDGDGKVTLTDISAFMGAWFTRAKVFDFNGDGRMTFSDFSILLSDAFFK